MRSTGIVLPIFSLPTNEGIGTLGESAYDFIDFLADSKQQYWQTPPLNHLTGPSPYSNYCVFSGNYYLIDIKKLVSQNLIDETSYKEYLKVFKHDNEKVQYQKLYIYKFDILKTAFDQSYNKLKDKINSFKRDNSYWIEDYALYTALKIYVFENKPWQEWDNSIKTRKKITVNLYQEQLKDHINFIIFLQYLFYSQWFDLKRYANSKNIKMIGEFPLYCNSDSCDVWSKPSLFMLNENLYPSEKLYHEKEKIYKKYCFDQKVTYNINNLKKLHYRFLIHTLTFLNNMYDNLIINNFDYYDKYKIINFDQSDINNQEFIEKISIKNDLFDIFSGLSSSFSPILHDVNFADNLLNVYNIPVSKTMTDGFSKKFFDTCLPHNYKRSDVIYTSDYIDNPLKKWIASLPRLEKSSCLKYINNNSFRDFNFDFIAKAYQSAADKILIPIQDLINSKQILFNPNKTNNNWTFRITQKDLNKSISNKLQSFSKLYER